MQTYCKTTVVNYNEHKVTSIIYKHLLTGLKMIWAWLL